MTAKNGTIEFRRTIKQAASVFNPMTKKLMKFNRNSDKYFTADPSEIKILDKLGYERSCVKLDGVKVDVESLSDEDIKRVMKALEIRAEKLGVEVPKIREDVAEEQKEDGAEEVVEEVKEEVKEEVVEEVKETSDDLKEDKELDSEKAEKKIKKNKLSSKLAAEIGE